MNRNLGFDLLRAIGLLCIILAHVSPPNWLFQIRTFDVVLLVAISTLSYTEYAKPKPYLQYVKSRLKRLLIPTWKYIILVGVVFFVISLITKTPTAFPIKRLVIGMLTMSSVGYLWIIRVYLYNAFINPFILNLQKVRNKWGGVILCVLIIYIIYSALEHLCVNSSVPHLATLSEATFLDFIAYSLIAIVSYLLYHSSKKHLLISSVVLLLLLLVVTFIIGDFTPNTYKYPPLHQYIIWGLLCVSVSFYILQTFQIKRLPRCIVFISENSLWVYFWHLILINFIKYYPQYLPDSIVSVWWIQWIVVVGFALLMCYCQNALANKLKGTKFQNIIK